MKASSKQEMCRGMTHSSPPFIPHHIQDNNNVLVTYDDVSGEGWAADERLDYKGLYYICKGEEVFLEVSAHALSFGDRVTHQMSSF